MNGVHAASSGFHGNSAMWESFNFYFLAVFCYDRGNVGFGGKAGH